MMEMGQTTQSQTKTMTQETKSKPHRDDTALESNCLCLSVKGNMYISSGDADRISSMDEYPYSSNTLQYIGSPTEVRNPLTLLLSSEEWFFQLPTNGT